MPLLTSFTAQRDHLSRAVRGRCHWVLLADSPSGEQSLKQLAVLCSLSGLSYLEIGWGGIVFLQPRRGMRIWGRFLTLPKAKVPSTWIDAATPGSMVPGRKAHPRRDLIVISDKCEELIGAYERFWEGKTRPAVAAEAN